MTFKGKKIIRLLGRIKNGTATIIIQYTDKSIETLTYKIKRRRAA